MIQSVQLLKSVSQLLYSSLQFLNTLCRESVCFEGSLAHGTSFVDGFKWEAISRTLSKDSE